MLEAVNRKVEHLRFMDPISDFLYPFLDPLLSAGVPNQMEIPQRENFGATGGLGPHIGRLKLLDYWSRMVIMVDD